MFKTLKSINLTLVLVILFVFSTVNFVSAYNSLVSSKNLRIKNCDVKVSNLADNLNSNIESLQEKVKYLAFLGKVFSLSSEKTQHALNYRVSEFFKHKNLTIGGGIWFEPYVIHKDKSKFFSFVYHAENKITLNHSYYDYLNTGWYNEIKSHIESQKIVWTKPYRDNSGSKELMITVGSEIYDRNKKFIGMATVDWELTKIVNTISNFNITPSTITIFADQKNDFVIATNKSSFNKDLFGKSLKAIDWYRKDIKNGDKITIKKEAYRVFIKKLSNEMVLIVGVPEDELFSACLKQFYVTLLIVFFICFSTVVLTYFYFKKYVQKPVEDIVILSKKISEGNLEVEIEIEKPKEFSDFAKVLNKTKDDIKMYIKNREATNLKEQVLKRDLAIAKEIQSSVLPNVSSVYPNHKEFEIYAKMKPALEVGGDFYDFFFIDDTHLVYLVADVSEKGIPAALFMMTTKATIKDIAKTEISPEALLTKLNHKIYETNSQRFFVTLFLAVTDITTGKTIIANAGHNPPLIKRSGGEFEYLKINPNFVVGLRDKINFTSYETTLNPNDVILLYTDGVTETINQENQLYGEKRLKQTINTIYSEDKELKTILKDIKTNTESFSQGMEQADDITMLIFKYLANTCDCESKILTVPAKVEELGEINAWVEKICSKANIDKKKLINLKILVEEVFVNIAEYAYKSRTDGNVKIELKMGKEEIELNFIDEGLPFNPLEIDISNLSAEAKERINGGLGITLIRGIADELGYNYIDGKNVFIIKLKIN